MEELVKIFTLYLGVAIEGVAGVLVVVTIAKSLWYWLHQQLNKQSAWDVRLEMGKSLALALEFLLAADIVRTAVAPTWNDIGKLAAIAALRTLLNYFLERELKQNEAQ